MRPWDKLLVSLGVVCGMMSFPACAETIQVTIDKLELSPVQITAKVGDTIEWINKDIFAHTATVKGDWDVTIPARKSGSFVLKKAGDVEYYCRFHPNMRGRIAVTAKP